MDKGLQLTFLGQGYVIEQSRFDYQFVIVSLSTSIVCSVSQFSEVEGEKTESV